MHVCRDPISLDPVVVVPLRPLQTILRRSPSTNLRASASATNACPYSSDAQSKTASVKFQLVNFGAIVTKPTEKRSNRRPLSMSTSSFFRTDTVDIRAQGEVDGESWVKTITEVLNNAASPLPAWHVFLQEAGLQDEVLEEDD